MQATVAHGESAPVWGFIAAAFVGYAASLGKSPSVALLETPRPAILTTRSSLPYHYKSQDPLTR